MAAIIKVTLCVVQVVVVVVVWKTPVYDVFVSVCAHELEPHRSL